MSPIEIIMIAGLTLGLAIIGTSTVVLVRETMRRRKREQDLAEMIALANDAFAAEFGKSRAGIVQAAEVDPDSPLGRQIIKTLGLDQPCQCPNCEEERRIQHAAEQKRDGK